MMTRLLVETERRKGDLLVGEDSPSTVYGIFGRLVRETVLRPRDLEKPKLALRMYQHSGLGLSTAYLFRAAWLPGPDIYIRLNRPIENSDPRSLKHTEYEAGNVFDCLLAALIQSEARGVDAGGPDEARKFLAESLPPRIVRSVE